MEGGKETEGKGREGKGIGRERKGRRRKRREGVGKGAKGEGRKRRTEGGRGKEKKEMGRKGKGRRGERRSSKGDRRFSVLTQLLCMASKRKLEDYGQLNSVVSLIDLVVLNTVIITEALAFWDGVS